MKIVILICAALLAGACSWQPFGQSPSDTPSHQGLSSILSELTGQNGRACVRIPDIKGYAVSDHGKVIRIDANNTYYIATTRARCSALNGSATGIFNGSFNDFCGNPTSHITTNGATCYIEKLFSFNNREEAFNTLNTATQRAESEATAPDE